MYEGSSVMDDFSYSQQTQTQPQTQTASQPHSATGPSFPSHLWGLLVSVSASSSPDVTNTVAAVQRPQRFEFTWDKKQITVGRHPACDLRLNSAKISSDHARIWWDEEAGVVKLEDKSTNGTYVANRKVGKGNVTVLENGNSVVFGHVTNDFVNDFRYSFQGPDNGSSRPSQQGDAAESSRQGIYAAYEIREQIGKGSFATVHRGVQRSTGKIVAVKVIQKARFASNPKTMEMFGREVDIMKGLDHKFCVKCIDCFEDDDKIWLVLEFVDGGDLLDYVMKNRGLSETDTREIGLMVCEAVAYLHSRRITHRDLKPENLLLTKGTRPICKVTDFGLAKMVHDGTKLATMCGTPTYLAPEVIINNNPTKGYSTAVDAWSIGVILYSCLTNQTPFDESESAPLPERMLVRKVELDPLHDVGASPTAIDFIQKLLVNEPERRMSVVDALKHPWLATTVTDGQAAAPLITSSLPFNGGTAGGQTPSITSPAMSTGNSFVDSQGLGNLRLSGSALRQAGGFSAQFSPGQLDGHEGDLSTEAGDQTIDATEQIDTPSVAPLAEPSDAPSPSAPRSTDVSMLISPSNGTKRKEPPSAFSSESDLESSGRRGSAMSLDGAVIAPVPLGNATGELQQDVSMAFDLPTVPESKVLEVVPVTAQTGQGTTEEDQDEPSTEEPATEHEESTTPARRSSRRTSGANGATKGAGTTPRKKGGRGSTGGTPRRPVSASPEVEAIGMTTRRRAKAARLS